MPQALAIPLFTTFAAGVATTYTVGSVLWYLGTSAITSWALAKLSPTPSIGGSRGLQVNGMDGTAPHDYIYGTMRKGGTRTEIEEVIPTRCRVVRKVVDCSADERAAATAKRQKTITCGCASNW